MERITPRKLTRTVSRVLPSSSAIPAMDSPDTTALQKVRRTSRDMRWKLTLTPRASAGSIPSAPIKNADR